MYKVWEINDIRFIINEISKIWNYPCGINIEISKRLTKRMEATEKLKLLSKYQNFRKISEVKYV